MDRSSLLKKPQKHAFEKQDALRWMTRTRVSVPHERVTFAGTIPSVGAILTLNQKVGLRWSCVFGVFRVKKINDSVVILDALSRVSSSRMQLWAESQSLKPEWQWKLMPAAKSASGLLQQCHNWIEDASERHKLTHDVRGNKFFIRGSRYSEAQIQFPDGASLEIDHMRKGWWIQAPYRERKVVVVLRNAATGLPEQLTLNFSSLKEKKSKTNAKPKKNELHKSIVLPGWD